LIPILKEASTKFTGKSISRIFAMTELFMELQSDRSLGSDVHALHEFLTRNRKMIDDLILKLAIVPDFYKELEVIR
jgi:hypothetical protein